MVEQKLISVKRKRTVVSFKVDLLHYTFPNVLHASCLLFSCEAYTTTSVQCRFSDLQLVGKERKMEQHGALGDLVIFRAILSSALRASPLTWEPFCVD